MSLKPELPQTKIGNEFFDPKPPELPLDVLGMPTEPLLNLSKALGEISMMEGVNLPIYMWRVENGMPRALSLFPLIERIQSGETIVPEDVRPYRKPIKRLVPKLNSVDRFAALSAGLGFGVPIRKSINRRIEAEFAEKVPPLLDKASDYLPQAEPYVDFIGGFENPREQFISELSIVADGVHSYALSHAKGKRNFDGEISAKDAAFGIRKTIEDILSNQKDSEKRLPMFSHLVIEHVPRDAPLPSSDVLGVAAPEIIRALESALPKDKRHPGFLASIISHPHPKRWLAEKFKGTQLRSAIKVANLLLPSIRDLLPATGKEVFETFERVKEFLKVNSRDV